MINTRVKWIYGVFGLEGNDLEYKINNELEKLEKQYGDIIVKHIEIVSNGFGKDAFIVYEYKKYNKVNGEVEKICSCNKCDEHKCDKNNINNKIKEYKSNITVLDDYYVVDPKKNKEGGNKTYHYIKIKDNNKLISKTKLLKDSSSEVTHEMIDKYVKKQLKEEI